MTRRLEQLEGAPAGTKEAAMHTRVPSMGWSTLASSRDPAAAAAGDVPPAASSAAPPEALASSSPDGWASFSSPTHSFKAAEQPQEEHWGGLDVAGPLAAGPSGRDGVLSSHPSRSHKSETAAELRSLSIGSEGGSELEQARQRIGHLEQHAKALESIAEVGSLLKGADDLRCSRGRHASAHYSRAVRARLRRSGRLR